MLALIVGAFVIMGWKVYFSGEALIPALLTGGLLILGQRAIFHAFKLGPVCLASPFVSVYALVAALLSIVFLHERLRPIQLVAVFFLVLGGMLASVSHDTHRPQKRFWRQPTVYWALVGAICIGISLFFLAQLVHLVGWQNSMLAQGIIVILGVGTFMTITKESFFSSKYRPINKTIIGIAAFGFIGTILVNYGFSSSLVAIVAPVTSVSPLITVALALYFFKERLSRYQLIGALVVILGLTLLSIR